MLHDADLPEIIELCMCTLTSLWLRVDVSLVMSDRISKSSWTCFRFVLTFKAITIELQQYRWQPLGSRNKYWLKLSETIGGKLCKIFEYFQIRYIYNISIFTFSRNFFWFLFAKSHRNDEVAIVKQPPNI